jgi:hypothetical protein
MSRLKSRPPLRGIHARKFAVSDIDESLRSYERALGAKRLPDLDQSDVRPLAIAVDDRVALERWEAARTELGVPHSPILDAVRGWLTVIQDPDGNRRSSPVGVNSLHSPGSDLAAMPNRDGWPDSSSVG